MTRFRRLGLTLCCLLPLVLVSVQAQAGGNAVNIPGIGRVVINPDGTVTLPGGQTISVNPNGTITLPGGQTITLPAIPGGGGGIIPGGGGGVVNPNTDPRIVAGTAILIGDDASAAVVIPNTGGGGGGLINNNATYLWSIVGGRITSTDLTRANVDYTADRAGTLRLTCVVGVAGAQPFTATADVTVVDPATAGAITTNPTIAAATTATGTASVPVAQNNDRTIRWTITGTAARITAGANTNQVTFIPGDPGIKELTCDVTLTAARVTVTLRSFVVVQGSGPAVPLTVNGGFGGGTYPGGSRVDVFAAAPAAGQVFDRWTGDTAVLGTSPIAPLNSRVLITLPNTPVTLTATSKPPQLGSHSPSPASIRRRSPPKVRRRPPPSPPASPTTSRPPPPASYFSFTAPAARPPTGSTRPSPPCSCGISSPPATASPPSAASTATSAPGTPKRCSPTIPTPSTTSPRSTNSPPTVSCPPTGQYS
jgi:hypothetical protein